MITFKKPTPTLVGMPPETVPPGPIVETIVHDTLAPVVVDQVTLPDDQEPASPPIDKKDECAYCGKPAFAGYAYTVQSPLTAEGQRDRACVDCAKQLEDSGDLLSARKVL